MTPRPNSLTTLRQLAAFIRFLIFSGRAADSSKPMGGRPQSIFLVAEPGSGKTELLDRFRPNSTLEYFSDITMRQLIPQLRKARRGDITHIVVTEFQKIISRRKNVADNFLGLMLQAMEEGVRKVAFGPQFFDLGGARLGLLAASTVTSMQRHPHLVNELAMDSRMWLVDARSTALEIQEIERRIVEGDGSMLRPILLRIPERPVKVVAMKKPLNDLRLWVKEMQDQGARTYGIRALTRFVRTAYGVTLARGDDVLRPCHTEELYQYKRFWLKQPDVDALTDAPEADND